MLIWHCHRPQKQSQFEGKLSFWKERKSHYLPRCLKNSLISLIVSIMVVENSHRGTMGILVLSSKHWMSNGTKTFKKLKEKRKTVDCLCSETRSKLKSVFWEIALFVDFLVNWEKKKTYTQCLTMEGRSICNIHKHTWITWKTCWSHYSQTYIWITWKTCWSHYSQTYMNNMKNLLITLFTNIHE